MDAMIDAKSDGVPLYLRESPSLSREIHLESLILALPTERFVVEVRKGLPSEILRKSRGT